MKAIIPTGGRGTRMRPLTFSTNKHFIPLANKPLIFYPIETVANAGIKEIALTYNPEGLEETKSILGDGSRWGLKFEFVLQEEPKGLANIFQVCEEYLAGSSFVMHLGDNIFVDGISDLVNHFEKNKPDGLVAMVHHKENTRLGVPYFDKDGHLIDTKSDELECFTAILPHDEQAFRSRTVADKPQSAYVTHKVFVRSARDAQAWP